MTSVAELVRLATAFKARLWVNDDKVELDAPTDFPSSLLRLLRQHKPEVLKYLREHPQPTEKGYRIKYHESPQPCDRELEEIQQTVQQQGFVLLWSSTLNDLVVFHRSDLDPQLIPPGFVPYSTREMEVLFGLDDDPPIESLRLIHEIKKFGSRIIDVLNEDPS